MLNDDYALHALFPQGGQDNRLAPEQTITTDRFIANIPHGVKHLVVITTYVREDEQHVDFRYLARPAIPREAHRAGPQAPLHQLLASFLDGTSTVRGDARLALDTYALRLLSWTHMPSAPTS